ncbi:hypothetical protein PIB30_071745 [Stylosanthes scabra]|uniref:Uncharacterized protein n=1 Tax=Stylosanthes scabra TaxID=79078 RepID=A0ABU6ZMI0_9FABA|nr:hypothetical protein [Stylosanthes scabra]
MKKWRKASRAQVRSKERRDLRASKKIAWRERKRGSEKKGRRRARIGRREAESKPLKKTPGKYLAVHVGMLSTEMDGRTNGSHMSKSRVPN